MDNRYLFSLRSVDRNGDGDKAFSHGRARRASLPRHKTRCLQLLKQFRTVIEPHSGFYGLDEE